MCDEHLEQRALAGAVAADDPERLAVLDLEVDVLERPEILRDVRRRARDGGCARSAAWPPARACRAGCGTLSRSPPMRYILPRPTVRRAMSLIAYTTSANTRSMRLK